MVEYPDLPDNSWLNQWCEFGVEPSVRLTSGRQRKRSGRHVWQQPVCLHISYSYIFQHSTSFVWFIHTEVLKCDKSGLLSLVYNIKSIWMFWGSWSRQIYLQDYTIDHHMAQFPWKPGSTELSSSGKRYRGTDMWLIVKLHMQASESW